MIALVEDQSITVKRCLHDILYCDENSTTDYSNCTVSTAPRKRRRVTFNMKQTDHDQSLDSSSASLSSSTPASLLSREEIKETCWLSISEYHAIRASVFETIQAYEVQQQRKQGQGLGQGQEQEQGLAASDKQNATITNDDTNNICIRGLEHYASEEVAKERSRNRSVYRRMIILKFRLQQYQQQKEHEQTNFAMDDPLFGQKLLCAFGTEANAQAMIDECCSAQEVLTLADTQKAYVAALNDAMDAHYIHNCI